jgi:HK97 family phage portal protein
MANSRFRRLLNALVPSKKQLLSSVDSGRGWWPLVREGFAGAWQRNVTVDFDRVISHHADFACKTLIASDIAKLRVKLVQKDAESGVWEEVDNFNFRVIPKPNGYQTRIQFFEAWMISKLQRGNTYVLKQRDRDGRVIAMYVLDPELVTPLLAENGQIFYELDTDHLSGLMGMVTVPASEIIHDRFNCLRHWLVGMSPIFAGGLSALQGLTIQESATKFFQNGARPGGILSAPGTISNETATRLKEHWDNNFSGANAGKVAVLGDDLKYQAMAEKATDSQLIEQLKWTTEVICSTYHVPPYKIGIGPTPSYNNIQALNVEYYSQCLQRHIEDIEILLDEGLGLNGEAGSGSPLGTEFDIDGLLRMDSASLFEVLEKGKSVMTLDERRRRVDLPKLEVGGGTVYLQQQDHSVEAIAARDKLLIDQAENPPEPTPPASGDEMSLAHDAIVGKLAAHLLPWQESADAALNDLRDRMDGLAKPEIVSDEATEKAVRAIEGQWADAA